MFTKHVDACEYASIHKDAHRGVVSRPGRPGERRTKMTGFSSSADIDIRQFKTREKVG